MVKIMSLMLRECFSNRKREPTGGETTWKLIKRLREINFIYFDRDILGDAWRLRRYLLSEEGRTHSVWRSWGRMERCLRYKWVHSSGSSGEKPRLDTQICERLVPGRFRDLAECVGRWEWRLDLSPETRSLGIDPQWEGFPRSRGVAGPAIINQQIPRWEEEMGYGHVQNVTVESRFS